MLNHIRLMFIALFMGLFLVACGDDSAQQDAAEEAAAPTEMAAEEAATEASTADDSNSVVGMTEEEAVAKWGEPDLTQSRTIDALTVTHHEWHGEDGITAVQFQNGVAQFSQFVAAE
jgi:ABC-type enterochelin transport system substrate-binding protein